MPTSFLKTVEPCFPWGPGMAAVHIEADNSGAGTCFLGTHPNFSLLLGQITSPKWPSDAFLAVWLSRARLLKYFHTNDLFGSLLNKAHEPLLRMFSNRFNKTHRITKERNYTEIHLSKYLKSIFMVSSVCTFLLTLTTRSNAVMTAISKQWWV